MDSSSTPWRVLEDPATPDAPGSEWRATQHEAGQHGGSGWRWDRRRIGAIVVLGLAALLGTAAFLLAAGGDARSVDLAAGAPIGSRDVPTSPGPGATIVVEVAGAVVRPGVLTLPAGSRVNDAIVAAGGYSPRIDAGRASHDLNLAAVLKDGDRILVPSRDDPPSDSGTGSSGSGGGSNGTAGGSGDGAGKATPLDLNHATAAELDALPGIGPVTAAKIIASRDEKRFTAVDDLRTRKLVGQKVFDGLRGLITVR